VSAAELSERLEVLELRYAHQEAALEELTRTLLAQEQLIRRQAEQLQRMEHQLRALQGGAARSLRMDNLGKAVAAQLLRMEVEAPADLPRLRPQ